MERTPSRNRKLQRRTCPTCNGCGRVQTYSDEKHDHRTCYESGGSGHRAPCRNCGNPVSMSHQSNYPLLARPDECGHCFYTRTESLYYVLTPTTYRSTR